MIIRESAHGVCVVSALGAGQIDDWGKAQLRLSRCNKGSHIQDKLLGHLLEELDLLRFANKALEAGELVAKNESRISEGIGVCCFLEDFRQD